MLAALTAILSQQVVRPQAKAGKVLGCHVKTPGKRHSWVINLFPNTYTQMAVLGVCENHS